MHGTHTLYYTVVFHYHSFCLWAATFGGTTGLFWTPLPLASTVSCTLHLPPDQLLPGAIRGWMSQPWGIHPGQTQDEAIPWTLPSFTHEHVQLTSVLGWTGVGQCIWPPVLDVSSPEWGASWGCGAVCRGLISASLLHVGYKYKRCSGCYASAPGEDPNSICVWSLPTSVCEEDLHGLLQERRRSPFQDYNQWVKNYSKVTCLSKRAIQKCIFTERSAWWRCPWSNCAQCIEAPPEGALILISGWGSSQWEGLSDIVWCEMKTEV